MATSFLQPLLPELCHPLSGRLDAARIAAFLDVPLDGLATAIALPVASVALSPDDPAFQPALAPIKRALDLLMRVFGDHAAVRGWLGTPLPDFGERTPLAVILAGDAEVVRDLLEDAVAGMPG